MRMDYSASTVIGFAVSVEDFFKKFLVRRDPEFNLEDRWDPKTGKKVEPESVMVRPGGYNVVFAPPLQNTVFTFEGPEDISGKFGWNWCPDQDLISALGELFGCQVFLEGDYPSNDFWICFQPNSIKGSDTVPITAILKAQDEFNGIAARAIQLGVEIGAPAVHTILSVY